MDDHQPALPAGNTVHTSASPPPKEFRPPPPLSKYIAEKQRIDDESTTQLTTALCRNLINECRTNKLLQPPAETATSLTPDQLFSLFPLDYQGLVTKYSAMFATSQRPIIRANLHTVRPTVASLLPGRYVEYHDNIHQHFFAPPHSDPECLLKAFVSTIPMPTIGLNSNYTSINYHSSITYPQRLVEAQKHVWTHLLATMSQQCVKSTYLDFPHPPPRSNITLFSDQTANELAMKLFVYYTYHIHIFFSTILLPWAYHCYTDFFTSFPDLARFVLNPPTATTHSHSPPPRSIHLDLYDPFSNFSLLPSAESNKLMDDANHAYYYQGFLQTLIDRMQVIADFLTTHYDQLHQYLEPYTALPQPPQPKPPQPLAQAQAQQPQQQQFAYSTVPGHPLALATTTTSQGLPYLATALPLHSTTPASTAPAAAHASAPVSTPAPSSTGHQTTIFQSLQSHVTSTPFTLTSRPAPGPKVTFGQPVSPLSVVTLPPSATSVPAPMCPPPAHIPSLYLQPAAPSSAAATTTSSTTASTSKPILPPPPQQVSITLPLPQPPPLPSSPRFASPPAPWLSEAAFTSVKTDLDALQQQLLHSLQQLQPTINTTTPTTTPPGTPSHLSTPSTNDQHAGSHHKPLYLQPPSPPPPPLAGDSDDFAGQLHSSLSTAYLGRLCPHLFPYLRAKQLETSTQPLQLEPIFNRPGNGKGTNDNFVSSQKFHSTLLFSTETRIHIIGNLSPLLQALFTSLQLHLDRIIHSVALSPLPQLQHQDSPITSAAPPPPQLPPPQAVPNLDLPSTQKALKQDVTDNRQLYSKLSSHLIIASANSNSKNPQKSKKQSVSSSAAASSYFEAVSTMYMYMWLTAQYSRLSDITTLLTDRLMYPTSPTSPLPSLLPTHSLSLTALQKFSTRLTSVKGVLNTLRALSTTPTRRPIFMANLSSPSPLFNAILDRLAITYLPTAQPPSTTAPQAKATTTAPDPSQHPDNNNPTSFFQCYGFHHVPFGVWDNLEPLLPISKQYVGPSTKYRHHLRASNFLEPNLYSELATSSVHSILARRELAFPYLYNAMVTYRQAKTTQPHADIDTVMDPRGMLDIYDAYIIAWKGLFLSAVYFGARLRNVVFTKLTSRLPPQWQSKTTILPILFPRFPFIISSEARNDKAVRQLDRNDLTKTPSRYRPVTRSVADSNVPVLLMRSQDDLNYVLTQLKLVRARAHYVLCVNLLHYIISLFHALGITDELLLPPGTTTTTTTITTTTTTTATTKTNATTTNSKGSLAPNHATITRLIDEMVITKARRKQTSALEINLSNWWPGLQSSAGATGLGLIPPTVKLASRPPGHELDRANLGEYFYLYQILQHTPSHIINRELDELTHQFPPQHQQPQQHQQHQQQHPHPLQQHPYPNEQYHPGRMDHGPAPYPPSAAPHTHAHALPPPNHHHPHHYPPTYQLNDHGYETHRYEQHPPAPSYHNYPPAGGQGQGQGQYPSHHSSAPSHYPPPHNAPAPAPHPHHHAHPTTSSHPTTTYAPTTYAPAYNAPQGRYPHPTTQPPPPQQSQQPPKMDYYLGNTVVNRDGYD